MSLNTPASQLYIGLMSGTSADGMDAALVEIDDEHLHLKEFLTLPMNAQLKQALTQLNTTPEIALESLCSLHREVALLGIEAVQQLLQRTGTTAKAVTALGSHGHTLYHAPAQGVSIQIGHPAIIAKQTGIISVADFRMDDMALGGQGAPIAPAMHSELFNAPCAVVNIGGISNISVLKTNQNISGWDCGPGNALMDEYCQRFLQQNYDINGERAAQGIIHQELLKQLLKHAFFAQTAPKSTGRETFHLNWVLEQAQKLSTDIKPNDMLATLNELTAVSIAHQLEHRNDNVKPAQKAVQKNLWVVGGGAYNPVLLTRLQANLTTYNVQSSQTIGLNPNAIEAIMMAWLAYKRVQQQTVSLATVTGAQKNAILGGLWMP